MKKAKRSISYILIVFLILCASFASACATKIGFEQSDITVTLLDGEHYHVDGENKVIAKDGEFVFTVIVDDGYVVKGAFGDKCEIIPKSHSLSEIRFKDIRYNCVAQLETEKPDQVYSIYYYLGDRDPIYQDCSALLEHHPKANTLTERNLREQGYINDDAEKMLVGWQTEDGEYIGLGSRAEVSDEEPMFLSAVWKDYSDTDLFTVQDGKITKYTGNEEEIVIPRKIDGNDITTICANAFENCKAKSFYIPSTVTTIEPEAFKNCETMTDFYMSDNITEISDMSFCGCKNFTTLHVNAMLDPVYSVTSEAVKADVMNRLESYRGKKLVVTGGSSVTFGYNTDVINKNIEGYQGFNFGLNAAMNAYFWYDMIEGFLEEGDIYLHAPEICRSAVYTFLNPSCLTDSMENLIQHDMFQIFESDWRLLDNLTVNKYCNVFDLFKSFNQNRLQAIEKNQAVSYESYNGELDDYGCINETCPNCGYQDFAFGFNGLFNFVDVEDECLAGTGEVIYKPLAQRGIKVFFAFPPLNESNLLRNNPEEGDIERACELYTQRVKRVLSDYPVLVLLSQIDSVYPSETFCNTDYHLGYDQSLIHTQKVMQALKSYLE